MIRPSGRREDDDLGYVTDMTGRVQGRTVTASSRGVRGRHSTSNLPSTPTPLPAGLHYDTASPTVRPHIPYRSSAQEPLTEFSGPARHAHGYTVGDYGVSSSKPFMGRQSADLRFDGDRSLGEEHDRVLSLHIGREEDERDDDGGNVKMLETKSSLCLWHLWHLLVNPTGGLVTGKGKG
ncbi:hypothetical protein M9H77_34776 [Catharanthus roseus]|uniref:Uncharacterized protein n=1 Tax=Catharanthus roseus TaxID=4058 RepID=A0ACB9ZM49_CATRO|nr:hypothetical protein M9H77_34776 [Catharanthus roseus]